MLTLPALALQHITKKGINMDKEVNGHLYIANDNLKRIADALEEVIRLVKADQEKMEHINLKEKYASLEPDPND